MKRILKQLLCMLIALSLVLGAVPAMALAPDGGEDRPSPDTHPEWYQPPEGWTDQIVYEKRGSESVLVKMWIWGTSDTYLKGNYDGGYNSATKTPVTTICTGALDVEEFTESMYLIVPPFYTRFEKDVMRSDFRLNLVFLGYAPTFDPHAFDGRTVRITYPANDPTWEGVVGQQFGGTVTWVARKCEHEFVSRLEETPRCSNCHVYCYHGFDFENGDTQSYTPPTCTSQGSVSRQCICCGEYIYHQLPTTDHTPGEDLVIQEPTCAEKGSRSYTCTECGKFVNGEVLPTIGHTPGDDLVIQEPTCTMQGVRLFTCAHCGDKVEEAISRIPHNYETTILSGGCTEDIVQVITCTLCGDTKQKTVPAAGHDFAKGVWITKATCTEPGEKSYNCNNCDYVKYVDFPATGHMVKDGVCTTCGAKADFEYEVLDSNTCMITKHVGVGGDVVIPATLDGYSVTTIDSYAFDSDYAPTIPITSVTFPDTLTTINEYAFSSCNKLETLYFGNSAFKAHHGAFSCRSIKNIYLTSLDNWLNSEINGNFRTTYSLYINGEPLTDLVVPEDITQINDYAFWNCVSLKTVTIHDGVTQIGCYAFADCTSLEEIKLPASLESLGDSALENCSSLKSLELPEALRGIGTYAMRGCTSLTSLIIPENVESLGDSFVANCTSLENLYFMGPFPTICFYSLYGPACTAWYPASDARWGAYVKINEEGEMIWKGWAANCVHCYDNDVCTLCGKITAETCAEHSFADGACIYCDHVDPATCTHQFAKGVWVNKNTCTEDGEKNYLCTICGYVKHVTFAATGHSFADGICTTCGKYDPSTCEHSYGQTVVITAPTCTQDGECRSECTLCGNVKTETVEATGHEYDENGVCLYCASMDPSGSTLTGSMLLPCENARVQLYISSEETCAATAQITGERYLFEGIAPGEYILKVSCDGGVPREYPVTLNVGENTQDVTLSRPGDVTGDGTMNILDVARIYASIKGTSPLEGYSAACADVNGDGKVNILDTAMAYSRTKG